MIKFADPRAQYDEFKEEIDKAISDVLNSDSYILGEQVSFLEKEFSQY